MNTVRLASALLLSALAYGCLTDAESALPTEVVDCSAPAVACGAVCVDTNTDPENCGGCNQGCESGAFCSMGECVEECPSERTVCDRTCRDLASDPAHCGACDRPCVSGLQCVEGACVLPEGPSEPDARIRVAGANFHLCGRPIFMNGANTPWNRWNDFGGAYDSAWWSDHYALLHDAGGNSSRVWITCNGEVGIDIAEDGTVLGATPEHWEHLDDFFAIAEEQQIYVMATLMSFDHFEDRAASRWRAWLASDEAIDSYVDNYVLPFLERYGENPYLWSIDLINEPDWVHERWDISWDRLRAYFARAARAIHAESEVLVTVGTASPKYNARCVGCRNEISDGLLREALDDPDVYLDFYSPHYYDWVGELWGNSLHEPPDTASFPGDKPLLHGEHPAHGTTALESEGGGQYTLAQDVEAAFSNGWQGTMPWTSNGVDRNGGFPEVSAATAAFRDAHPDRVFPSCP